MRSLLAVFALLAFLVFTTAPATAHEGCTPGFWKNNTSDAVWGPTGYHTTDKLGDVFAGVTNWGKYGISPNDSLLTALGYQGGPGLNGAAQILLRTAVAALLNASHPDMGFVGGTGVAQFVINTIVANLNVTYCFAGPGLCATDAGLRASLIALATLWDSINNENPCPIDAFGRPIVG